MCDGENQEVAKPSAKEVRDHLWGHFQYNADQRMKAFNYYVILSVATNGGMAAALEKSKEPVLYMVIAFFAAIVSVVFWIIDCRSRTLLALDLEGLQAYEKSLPTHSQPFSKDHLRNPKIPGYSFAFRILYAVQALIACGVFLYATYLLGTLRTTQCI